MPSDYQREKGERFHSKGIRTGSPADALKPGQYPMLQNVRGNTETELTTRSGYVFDFATENNGVEQISSYADALATAPRILAKVNASVYLDTGAVVDTGYSTSVPSMIPLRPNQSPLPWMYVGDATQYRKLSAPDATNVVTAQNVGIEEPQLPPDVILKESPSQIIYALDAAANWSNSGACGAVSNGTRSTDTVVSVNFDPLSFAGSGTGTATIGVHDPIIYQRDEFVNWVSGGLTIGQRVNDVFTPLPAGISVAAIHYFSGSTGQCVVVPDILAPGPGNDMSLFEQAVLGSLRRGALVKIGSETCYVWDVEISPYGSISFTTSTTGTHTTAETLSGLPAIQFLRSVYVDALTPGTAISSYQWQFHCNSGVGTVEEDLITDLFFSQSDHVPFQPDDYLCFGLYLTHPENLIEMKVLINVTSGTVDYTADTYFYAVRQSDIQAGLQNTLTQLGVAQVYQQRQLIQNEVDAGRVAASEQSAPGANQWSQIAIRLRDLIRTGSDESQTLSNMLGIQFLFNCTGSGTDACISSILTKGQLQVDVGTVGQPIHYRVRGRSSVTGARSNPSPPTRYGWSPRRQGCWVTPPAVPDPQIDLWDIFRIGGTLDTYRLVGTIETSVPYFQDDYPDIMIAESEALDYDNLQPWPTLDYPLNVPAATVVGYVVTFTLGAGDPQLLTIPRYLPGNLVRINETVYTLYDRPTVVGTAVTFTLNENAGSGTSPLFIYEPVLANQPLPFLWGPSAEGGTVFGVGDTYRPGNVYFSKNFNADSVPDKYNLELSPPSEPLTGGCLLNGESFAFSASRCWALRPSFGGINQYTPRQVPTGVGAVNHFGICSDGKFIYFVAKDGIYATSGGPATLLTNRDNIYSLFPHEGQDGQAWTYGGYTIYPPLLYNLNTGSWTPPVPGAPAAFVHAYEFDILGLWWSIGHAVGSAIFFPVATAAGPNDLILGAFDGTSGGWQNAYGVGPILADGSQFVDQNGTIHTPPVTWSAPFTIHGPAVTQFNPKVLTVDYSESTILDQTSGSMSNMVGPSLTLTLGSQTVTFTQNVPNGGMAFMFRLNTVPTGGNITYVIIAQGALAAIPAPFTERYRHGSAGGDFVVADWESTETITGVSSPQMHLVHANGFLYFDYTDVNGNFQHLVYDLHSGAWYPDSFQGNNLTVHYSLPQEEPSASTLVFAGDSGGNVLIETADTTDNGNSIQCAVATREYCPDDRAYSWFGDCGIDLLPTANTALTAEGTSLGTLLGTPTTFPSSLVRQPLASVDLGGGQTLKSLGLLIQWLQTYIAPEVEPVVLYAWQPAFVPKPETSDGRYTDWHPRPAAGNRFWQGLLIEADTYNVGKIIRVRNGDTGNIEQVFPAVTFNGQQQQALSFTTPFVAHTVRLEPVDSVPWRLFNVEWVAIPYPEACLTWRTEGTAHSSVGLRQQVMRGFQYLYMGQLSYISTQPVNVILRFDYGSPITITLPATGMQLDPVKTQFKIPPNKFKIVSYEASSTAPFYLWESNVEFWCGHWGRIDPCEIVRPFGGMTGGPEARV